MIAYCRFIAECASERILNENRLVFDQVMRKPVVYAVDKTVKQKLFKT